jgi:hypothetical protein
MINQQKINSMKYLLIIILAAMASCNNQQPTEKQETKTKTEIKDTSSNVSLINGIKWKADEATKKNVADIMQIVKDTSYTDASKRQLLYSNMKSGIDKLVAACTMEGAAHDELHVWLEKILKDLKELKKGDEEYSKARTELKEHVERFYQIFE